MFTGDVSSTPLLPVGGALPVGRPVPDRLADVAAGGPTAARWRARIDQALAA
jgi:O-succinylbenzoate synthase